MAVMPEHTAKAFDVDLQELTRMVAEMGGLAEKQVADSVDALARRDTDSAVPLSARRSLTSSQRPARRSERSTIWSMSPLARARPWMRGP